MSGGDGTGQASRALVIGIGNPYRGDDGTGLAVAAEVRAAGLPGVRVTELEADLVTLIDAWEGADEVYLADAVCSGASPGTVYRLDSSSGLPPGPFRHRGTHTFSLADVIELGRALRRIPRRLVAYGVEGASFAAGTTLSPAAARGAGEAARQILSELAAGEGGVHVPGQDRRDHRGVGVRRRAAGPDRHRPDG